ncbi:hypothetical protein, partial [Paraburkholderia mimosarum]|uniref:hypothetical protein n=1 Tax=Paraburkholderia mimosarum TaxID=312026 RepID=UPI001ABA0C4C
EANLLVGDAGSRHVLTASSLRIDQPSYCPADAAPPVVRRLRRLRRLRLLTTGQNKRQRPAKIIVAAHKLRRVTAHADVHMWAPRITQGFR